MIVEEIVSEVVQRPLHIKCCDLRYEDDGCREYECRREIRVDRTEIGTEPIPCWDEDKPIEYESEEVPEEYDYDESPEEPHISVCHPPISDESCRICEDTWDDIESECSDAWETISRDRHIEDRDEDREEPHEQPRREDGVRDMDTTYRPVMDKISPWRGNMRTCMLCYSGCGWCCDFWGRHRARWKRAGVYRNEGKMQEEVKGKKKNPQRIGNFYEANCISIQRDWSDFLNTLSTSSDFFAYSTREYIHSS